MAAKRTPDGWARERRRYRSQRSYRGRDGECETGHPALFATHPAFLLERMPQGGGYPVGFFELACRLLDVPPGREGEVVHLCSGSVRAPITVDLREGALATVRADVRWLPFRPSSLRWILADPPYDPTYAEELWGTGKKYPSPTVLLEEAHRALAPGGRVGLIHFVVPRIPEGLERLHTVGVSTGPGYRIRAFTVAEKAGSQLSLT